MRANRIFPDRSLPWYLVRATLAFATGGAAMALILVVLISGMGDGGGDRTGLSLDLARSLIPNVVGWAVIGFALGGVWWLLGKVLNKKRPSVQD